MRAYPREFHDVAKPEWGVKRTCQSCSAVFYDMRRSPIACPKCGTEYDPEAVLKDVTHLLEVVAGGQKQLTLLSDEHKAYPRAIRQLACEVTHLVTSSKERRDARNRLFPVNLADMLLRHSSANHKRETIAWSKRRQASAERLAVFLVWRNYMKGRKEKVRGSPTPAQVRGMRAERLELAELLEIRLFASRITLPGRWLEYYGRRVRTRVLERQTVHDLKYAF